MFLNSWHFFNEIEHGVLHMMIAHVQDWLIG